MLESSYQSQKLQLPVNHVDGLTIADWRAVDQSSHHVPNVISNAREPNDPTSGLHSTTNPITHHKQQLQQHLQI